MKNSKERCAFRVCESHSEGTKASRLKEQEQARKIYLESIKKQCRNRELYKKRWYEGNGIEKSRLSVFDGKIRQCKSCSHCHESRCGICGLCLYTDDACVFRCCEQNSKKTRMLYYDEIDELFKRKNRCLSVGTRIYARWPKNNVSF